MRYDLRIFSCFNASIDPIGLGANTYSEMIRRWQKRKMWEEDKEEEEYIGGDGK